MYLSQTDKDPEVWQLNDHNSCSRHSICIPKIAVQTDVSWGPVWTDLRAREHERQTWLPGFVGSLCGPEHQRLPGGQEGALISTVWKWQQGWHRQYNKLGDRWQVKEKKTFFRIYPWKLDFWQIWRTLSYLSEWLDIDPQTSTMKYCCVCYDKFCSGHCMISSLCGLPLRESCWCWWAKCSDFREEIQLISWDDPPTWCTT